MQILQRLRAPKLEDDAMLILGAPSAQVPRPTFQEKRRNGSAIVRKRRR